MTGRSQHARAQQRLTAVLASFQVRRILAGDEELLAKLSKALLESYVDDNKEAKWCPSTPHCGNAIKVRLLPGIAGCQALHRGSNAYAATRVNHQ